MSLDTKSDTRVVILNSNQSNLIVNLVNLVHVVTLSHHRNPFDPFSKTFIVEITSCSNEK